MLKLAHRALLLAIVTIIFAGIWMMGTMFGMFPVPFKETFEARQVTCLAAILRADAYGEDPEYRALAQDYIADAVLRYRESSKNSTSGQATVQFCEILENGLTIYPKGWRKSKLYWKRDATAIKNSLKYTGSPWDEAYNRATEAIARGLVSGRCSTHYVRVKPRYTWATNELEAQEEIRNTMKPDVSVPSLKTMFFCP